MRRCLGIGAVFLLSAALLAPLAELSSARAEALTISHAQGVTELPSTPNKIITFDLSTLDTLTALGVDVAGVPAANLPPALQRYQDTPKVGSLFEPDYEAVNAMEPDLILVSGRSAPKYADLAKIAPTIDMTTDSKNFLPSAMENVRKLGKIFGKDAEAELALAELEAETALLREKAATAGNALLLLTTGGKMSTYGPQSRFGLLFSEYGFVPADDSIAAGNHGQPVSFEYILEKNPDWLFVIDRDAAIGQEGAAAGKLLDNELVRETKAWKTGQIVYLDSASWYLVGAGLNSLQSTVRQINEALDAQ